MKEEIQVAWNLKLKPENYLFWNVRFDTLHYTKNPKN